MARAAGQLAGLAKLCAHSDLEWKKPRSPGELRRLGIWRQTPGHKAARPTAKTHVSPPVLAPRSDGFKDAVVFLSIWSFQSPTALAGDKIAHLAG